MYHINKPSPTNQTRILIIKSILPKPIKAFCHLIQPVTTVLYNVKHWCIGQKLNALDQTIVTTHGVIVYPQTLSKAEVLTLQNKRVTLIHIRNPHIIGTYFNNTMLKRCKLVI